ncbi:hypothetical protein BDZ89DRAFT_1141905 [Hymenopellis radicata]|nr:hypothetical protein BDZ89DRAFT_1141905 [Hymenopellis radicata]
MPVPAAPRRAAPPRRKAAKSPAPPSVEERAAVNDDIEPPPPVPEVPIEPKPDELEPTIDEAQKRMSMDIVTAEVGESHVQPLAEALPTSPQAEEADVTEVPYNRDDSPTPSSPIHDDTPHLPSHKEEAPPPPDHEDTPPTIQEAEKDVPITEEPETEEVQEPFKDLEPSEVVAEHADDEEEDEEARKKRIAERMAKMGGVNPFAPPSLQRQTISVRAETDEHVVKRVDFGGAQDRVTYATIPQKRSSISSVQSFEKRKASMDASLEESRPIPPPRQMSKDDHKPSGISEDAEDSAALVGEDLDLGRESDDGRDAIEDEEIPSPPPVPTASRPPPVPQTTRPTPAQSDFDEDTFVPPPPRRRLSLQRVDEPEPEREQAPALSPTNEVAESPVAQDQKSPVPAVPHHLVDESPPASPVALHIPPPRRFSSDNEERALPHPMRFSDTVDEEEEQMSHRAPPRRGVPPPPPVSAVEPDEDDMLPAPPPPPRRSIPTPSDHPSSPPTRHIPPPPPDEDDMLPAPPPPRRNLPLEPPDLKTPVVTVQPEQEVLSEDEGDPIDPAFHSPSRRESLADAPSPPRAAPPTHSLSPESARMSLSPTSPTSEPSLPDEPEPAVDPEQERRRTIAERMAKLGGIKFGAPPVPMGRPRRQTQESKDDEEEKYSAPQGEQGEPAVEEEKVELTEEEEERARKERISAKLAMMGGQRIGMMPPVMGSRPPPQRHVEEDEVPPPPPPQRAVPPRVRPPPAENDEAAPPPPPHRAPPPSHSETDSDDGVKVEAEESEIEEVRHEDAVEAEEEAPPPVPTRAGRRTSSVHRQGSSDTGSSHRPPVPTSPPPRRASVQGKGDTSFTYPPPPQQQADFVMVEEPERAPTKQWELPSIPAASMDFGAGPDLSMSWSEVDNAGAPPPPPAAPVKAPKNFDEMVLSPEELTAVWGRIGVQVCEAATSLHDKSKKALIGDGTYHGFIEAVLAEVPGAARPVPPLYGYTVYVQSGASVQRRAGEIMPGDVVWLSDARLKGHKGLQGYSQHVGGEGDVVGVVCEFEAKKYKVRVFQANQHVGQQTVEAVSYRLEDLKSGVVKVFRVLEA